jgi:hypothetical protein
MGIILLTDTRRKEVIRMKAQKLKEYCTKLFEHFNDPQRCGDGTLIDLRILEIMGRENKYLEAMTDERNEKEGFKEGEEEAGEILFDFSQGLISLAFSYGFIIGRLLDPGWKEVKEVEAAILEDIKKEELLLYLPRKTKAP